MKFSAQNTVFALSVATNPGLSPIAWAWRYKILGAVHGWTFEETKKEMLKAQAACIVYSQN